MSYASRVYRQRNAHTYDEKQHEQFFGKSHALHDGSRKGGFFQAKMSINNPGDKYEREADAVAASVVNRNQNTPVIRQKNISSIQRLTSGEEEEKLSTNDARLRKDKEIQTKPEIQRMCPECEKEKGIQRISDDEKQEEETLQQKAEGSSTSSSLSGRIENSSGKGRQLPAKTLAEMNSSFGTDFSHVNIHTDQDAVQMNKELKAQAFTHGDDIYFNSGKYDTETSGGRQLLAHELTHVIQQKRRDKIQRQKSKEEPYIKKVSVNLTPSQSVSLEWAGTPPSDAPGSDSFTVSTGKGYSDPWDDPGTCLRSCCNNAETQCDSPYDKPGKTGACCTYTGKGFWTGTAVPEHNGWKWWTPIQPYYSIKAHRAIALHQHDTVTGKPIGHGCVRMDEANAKRIYDFSVIGRTKVEISGRASPVQCEDDQKCPSSKTKSSAEESSSVSESKEATAP